MNKVELISKVESAHFPLEEAQRDHPRRVGDGADGLRESSG